MAGWTETDIPDQSGRIALITGANSGIGFEAARALTQHGAHVVLACRSRAKADNARDAIVALRPSGSVSILDVDLSDLESVRGAAKTFGTDHTHLDLLINNAGVMATPKRATADGFELQLGTNHLGHFALTASLIESLLATNASRVVNISSVGHRMGTMNFDDLQSEQHYSPWRAYGRSKLANLLFTYELQRRLAEAGASTIATAAHPGGSNTNLGHDVAGISGTLMKFTQPVLNIAMQSASMGALPTLRAAVDPNASGGDYFGPGGFMEQRGNPVKVKSNKRSHNVADARQLWDVSCELTGVSWGALSA